TAIANLFYAQGAKLCLTAHSKASKNQRYSPERVMIRSLDVRKRSEVETLISESVERFGTIDVLINCTGILGPVGATSGVPAAEWVNAIEINLFGSFFLTQAVLPIMLHQKKGK